MKPPHLAHAGPAALLALGLLCGAGGARAQAWTLDASAGQTVHEALPGSTSSLGASLGLRLDGPRWLYLTGGLPFDSSGLPWGAVGAGGRLASAGTSVALGIDAGAHAYGYRDPVTEAGGGGATLEAMPLLAAAGGPARLELRSGVVHHARTFSGETAWRTVHQSDARVSFGSAGLLVVGEGRYVRAAEGGYPYAGAAVEAALERGVLWGYAGKWLADGIETPAWGAGARLHVAGPLEVYAAFQQETNDPLYFNAPRRSWSVGVSRRLGRIPSAASAPVPAPLAPEVRAGRVTFRVPADASDDPPALGGDFTRWEPVPMAREGGFWTVTLPVGSGVHRYAFRRAGGEWFVPESAPGRTDDGFGGVSATLVVP